MRHSPGTFENKISFRNVEMIFEPLFEIPYGNNLAKSVKELHVQVILRSMRELTK